MKALWFAAVTGCGAAIALAWSAGAGGRAGASLAALAVGGQPATVQVPPVSAIRQPQAAVRASAASIEPSEHTVQEASAPQERIHSPAAAELAAQRYFHALVVAEDLERSLPADTDAETRTRERFPGLFAAIEDRDRLATELTSHAPPSVQENLPALDFSAEGDDFERIYGKWSREDLLVENWRLSRQAYVESNRLLDQLARFGPFEPMTNPPLMVFG